ncbi:glycoside hydrolase family 3 C-terminal domain-containing protein [Microbacterium sp. NPDC077184]|uniref:glycoside hydrolase family 3 C-terminal domain-containing protein n=1 Tax=Microbacterium sp. NPDC077184 TaxID=3154764 RepID=UPI003415A212
MTSHAPLPEPADLTVEEKASLTSGATFWTTKTIDRPGAAVPSIAMNDGPHGLRKQVESADHLGMTGSLPATCFPPAVGLGSSWDADLAERVGAALGAEASIEDVGILLGPGVNIKRSPLCGRNFEYLSEDPLVSGVLGAALVRGIQSQGVGASLKHFAANNQETDRMRASSDVDEQTLREIYLRGFQRIVQDAQPWTVMCSYNRINGVYASEDPWLLTTVLRDEWGFEGLVVSDWGAVNDRVAGLAAGMDLEMPSSGGATDAEIVDAVRDGRLAESVLDTAAHRAIDLVGKVRAGAGRVPGPLDVDAHHALAREAAARSIVLLKNEEEILPLSPTAHIAVIGAFAAKPRYQGAGSSMINPTRLDTALDEITAAATAAGGSVDFAAGFTLSPGDTTDAAALRAEAVRVASGADVAVVFLGLPAAAESEGYDRTHIDLPAAQLAVLAAVREANPKVVVVLSNGSVVALPFADDVPAIVEAWLLGQAGGGATADILFGAANPSGKLAETIPLRLEDTPAHLSFGTEGTVRYGEGLFVGYRWYDARAMEVAYPFGHGLSYTTFAYEAASASVRSDGDVVVRAAVTNTGARAGREVVQVYVTRPDLPARPVRELVAFTSVALEAGETREVELVVARGDLAVYDVSASRWVVPGGEYALAVAASSRDIRARVAVDVEGDAVARPLSRESSLAEVLSHPVAGPVVARALAPMTEASASSAIMPEGVDMSAMLGSFPIGRIGMMAGMGFGADDVDRLLETANASEQPVG